MNRILVSQKAMSLNSLIDAAWEIQLFIVVDTEVVKTNLYFTLLYVSEVEECLRFHYCSGSGYVAF